MTTDNKQAADRLREAKEEVDLWIETDGEDEIAITIQAALEFALEQVEFEGELRPCPFCGGETGIYQAREFGTNFHAVTIFCQECGIEGKTKRFELESRAKQEAIKAWNACPAINKLIERVENNG